MLFQHELSCGEEKLQSHEPLLSVNDRMFRCLDCGRLDELEHDRPEKVCGRLTRLNAVRQLQNGIDDAHDVIPERLPLVLLGPDIRSLEGRYLVADVPVE